MCGIDLMFSPGTYPVFGGVSPQDNIPPQTTVLHLPYNTSPGFIFLLGLTHSMQKCIKNFLCARPFAMLFGLNIYIRINNSKVFLKNCYFSEFRI